jgi:predicted dehydrogenase
MTTQQLTMNRPGFLYGGVPSAAAMSARSYGRILGANDRVGIGVIGLGRRGTIVSAALLADILTHWVDVAQWMLDDPDPQTARALGGIYQLHDQRKNPDTVSAIVRCRGWNVHFESSVLSIREEHPSVFFEGTEGTLDLSRDGYTFTPNDGHATEISSTESLERAHTRNFVDAIVSGVKVNAPLKAGVEASLPVQMALVSYWSRKTVSQAQLM